MYRLFIGIDPPDTIKSQLVASMGGVTGARWQTADQLHLTLRFIGEVDRHQAEDLAAALAQLHGRRFDLHLSGVGMFDQRGIPAALWAGVRPHDSVAALHHKVDHAVTRTGLAPDSRAYLPHITLARLNRSSGPVDGFLAAMADLTSPPFTVDAVCLYESTLTRSGSAYSVIERYPLH